MMKRLHDYLDYDIINIVDLEGRDITGTPVAVLYSDEDPHREEDSIHIETIRGEFYGFYEKDIKSIRIIK